MTSTAHSSQPHHPHTPASLPEHPVHVEALGAVRKQLAAAGQEHLLKFCHELDAAGQRRLAEQINALDLGAIPGLVKTYVTGKPATALPPGLRPAKYYAAGSSGWARDDYRRAGEKIIRAGKVAAFTVAGGQGSRLGYEGPKGCYPAGAVTGKPLFAVFADALLGARDRHGVDVPWYIMTSPLNHDATVSFFEENEFLGLNRDNVRFFQQGVMPSFDMKTGRILLAEKGVIATNPDGHGGSIRALHKSGSLADMRERGVEFVSYFQVDNPIVNIIDPVFIGLHASAPDSSGEMSSKMVAKRDAAEKVGVFCEHDKPGRAAPVREIVEYSDMPKELTEAKNADGSLKFNAGSIAVHVMGVKFLEKIATDPHFALPFHRAEKKIPHVDLETGAMVNPGSNNGVKLEAFVFDALPLCERSIVLETLRVEEFAPIKNAEGADSPESSRRIQTERAAGWLESLGVKVARAQDGSPDCTIEISPRTATSADELAAALKGKLPTKVGSGERLVL